MGESFSKRSKYPSIYKSYKQTIHSENTLTILISMKRINLKTLAAAAFCCGLSWSLQANTIEGEIVAIDSGTATISVPSISEIGKGDPVKVVRSLGGSNFETLEGEVTHTMEGVAIVEFAKGNLDVGLRAVIDVKAPYHESDELSAIPSDKFAVAEGIMNEDMDAEAAVEACRKAIKAYPEESRFHAQLGRALEVLKKPAGAIIEYERALEIQPNYPVALHNLASIRFYGPVELRNFDVARKNFDKAAKLGYASSMPVIGSMCRDGLGGKKDLRMGAIWFKMSAEQGNAYSQFALGECYQNGWGLDKDLQQALLLYRSSAEKEYIPAMRNLGTVFAEGIGVDQNDEVALKWYEKAAQYGDSEAFYQLGIFYRDGRVVKANVENSLNFFNKASNKGHVEAKREIARIFYEGTGVERDYDIAAAWYLKAAEAGDKSAQFNVGVMLEKGQGLSRNKEEAIGWYKEAARQGHTSSQKRLIKLKTVW